VAATAAAVLFGGGLLIGGVGLWLGQPVLLLLGTGVIGGIGCGLGYIAPVSTLVKWFPDRRGMATGMAVMGFGGGAVIAGALDVWLMQKVGVPSTLLLLGVGYFVVMLSGATFLRRPPPGYAPPGYRHFEARGAAANSRARRKAGLTRNQALRTPQFWLLWGILFINVTAGIGILAQASPLMQDMFHRTAAQAGAMVSLISLFNAGGRLFWASLSDFLGRRVIYLLFFAVQAVLFLCIPVLGEQGLWWLFQVAVFTIFTMYGGGFATIPAFLADLFGPDHVGAVHGAVLTAWSAAAIAGPIIITQISQRHLLLLAKGASRVHIYDTSLHLLSGLLLLGLLLTLLVRPLPESSRADDVARASS
jgi:MFS family permease